MDKRYNNTNLSKHKAFILTMVTGVKTGFVNGITVLSAIILFAAALFSTQVVQAQDAPYERLYLVGDAAPNGWNIADPTPMEQDDENPMVFIYKGIIFPGEFKISTFTGDWCDGDWLLAPTQNPELDDTDETGYTVYTGCPPEEEDFKWVIDREEISEYTITVDLEAEVIQFVYEGPLELEYEELYILGSALSAGWNIENPDPMEQDDAKPWIFTYGGFFAPGVFKISTFTGDWCDGDWIRPPSMHPPLTDTAFIITTGCPPEEEDYVWEITAELAGDYHITVDLMDEIIEIETIDADAPPFEELFLVGDAAPGGWSLDEQTPMDQDTGNPFLFSWEGDLVAGEFKIKTYPENDFCSGEWIHPLEHEQPFSETSYEVLMGCGDLDNKWVVSEDQAGFFSIVVDTENETIDISGDNIGTTAGDPAAGIPLSFRLDQNYPNPFNPITNITYMVPENTHVTIRVYDVNGRRVITLVDEMHERGMHSRVFDGTGLASGVYIYRMSTESFTQSRTLMLVK